MDENFEIKEKFCENCGKTNDIETRFCNSCGNEFPEINLPKHKTIHSPPPSQSNIPPAYIDSGFQSGNYPPPNVSPSYSTGFNVIPPRAWMGGGLIQAIISMFRTPAKSGPELLEDPTAPSPRIIVLFMAITSSLIMFFELTKVTYTSIEVDPQFQSSYSTREGIRQSAMSSAFVLFIMIFIGWWFGSWVVSKLISGGLYPNSYFRHQTTQGLRRLFAYLYIPKIIENIIKIILIQFEENRTAEVTMTSIGSIPSPTPEFTSNFSSSYVLASLLMSGVSAIIMALVFYRVLKLGFGHRGISVGLITGLIALSGFL